jgi:hypothetical protein
MDLMRKEDSTDNILKVLAVIAALIATVILGFLERAFRPSYYMLEGSAFYPEALSWLGWILLSIAVLISGYIPLRAILGRQNHDNTRLQSNGSEPSTVVPISNPGQPITQTVGLTAPIGFPVHAFDEINQRVSRRAGRPTAAWRSFASAWNAVAYRLIEG